MSRYAHLDKVLEKGGPFTDEYFQAGDDVSGFVAGDILNSLK